MRVSLFLSYMDLLSLMTEKKRKRKEERQKDAQSDYLSRFLCHFLFISFVFMAPRTKRFLIKRHRLIANRIELCWPLFCHRTKPHSFQKTRLTERQKIEVGKIRDKKEMCKHTDITLYTIWVRAKSPRKSMTVFELRRVRMLL